MVDIDAVITEYLETQPGLTVHTQERLYASISLPKGYDPSNGKALLFNVRGGTPDYSSLVLRPSMQFRSVGKTEAEARELDRALFDALNDASYCKIKMAQLETIGQLLRFPATGWPFVLSFYRLFISAN